MMSSGLEEGNPIGGQCQEPVEEIVEEGRVQGSKMAAIILSPVFLVFHGQPELFTA